MKILKTTKVMSQNFQQRLKDYSYGEYRCTARTLLMSLKQ